MHTKALASAVLAVCLSAAVVGCDRGSDTGGTAATPTAGDRAGQAADNAAQKTGDAMQAAGDRVKDAANTTGNAVRDAVNNTGAAARDAANNAGTAANDAAATRPAGLSAKLPGMPSVNGTDTSHMTTADAAAQRLIDNARNNLSQNDLDKAKTLVSELKQPAMYDSLSADMKAKVDQLSTEVNKGATANNK
jgi:hypothetical protein